MKKLIFTIFACTISLSSLIGQQKEFDWRLGVSGGYSNYYGDLTPFRIRGLSNTDALHHLFYFNENYFDQYSFKISLEKSLSPTVGLQFSYGQYQYSMSDRYIQRNGEILSTSRNFDRALNFQNNTRDMGISLVFKTDNDRFLSSKSLLAPYFTLGFGFLDFDISGDLLDDEGNQYNYLDPNTLNNGIYETELSPLRTELEDGYDLGTFYANFGLGIRLRLGNRFEIFAQSDFIHSFSDYLDDVSGTYRDSYDNSFQAYAAKPGPNVVDPIEPNRGKNNGLNDWVIYHGVGIKFNFGASKTSFSAPRLSTTYPSYTDNQPIGPKAIEVAKKDSINESLKARTEAEPIEKYGNTYNYYTNIQMVDQGWRDSIEYKTKILTWDQQIASRKEQILKNRLEEKTLLEIQQNLIQNLDYLANDTILNASEKDSLKNATEKRVFDLRYSLDSIQKSKMQHEFEIDSIANLKNNYQIQSQVRSYLPYNYLLPMNQSDSILFGNESVRVIEDSTLTVQSRFSDEVIGEKSKNIASAKDSVSLVEDQSRPLLSQRANQFDQSDTLGQLQSRVEEDIQKKNSAQAERITKLEAESRRLKAERDSLNALPREVIYMGSRRSSSDNPSPVQYTEPQRITTNNQTVIRDRVVQQPERNRRERGGFWRTIGAFFGGAAVGKAVSSNDQNPTNANEEAVKEETQIDLEQINRVNRVATTWSFIALGLDQGELNRLAKNAAEKKSEMAKYKATEDSIVQKIPDQIIVRDTVFIENDPEIKLLRSKEIIYFQVNQREPDQSEIQKLGKMVEFVNSNEGYKILLTGYADNTGNVTYNLKLADERMKAVAGILEEKFGISASKISFESGGQVIRGSQKSSNDLDRKVEARIETEN
ncbi:OmpA family protein [Belliella sp. DSM 107340]|uniref:OmpA family protein n=1 Tax=Belliella calami TaxID=2923436 RepID=A0ABS9USM1_9BACT|nr:OmpA family protein [Belliella calami]MCH7399620.1 OmpA family protein [Belliella calami]